MLAVSITISEGHECFLETTDTLEKTIYPLAFDLAITLLGIYPEATLTTRKYICSRLFTAD